MDNINEINRKIAEIKKKILLAEGQKTANASEWQKQNRINMETIISLKNEIKNSTAQYASLKSSLHRSSAFKCFGSSYIPISTEAGLGRRVQYPAGAKNVDDAIILTDLKLTDSRKQLDLLHYNLHCRRKGFGVLLEQHKELLALKNCLEKQANHNPAEAMEEDNSQKLVCQLENEIHRTNVQWMEAEHVKKKYRSIQASLMNDAERFEKLLKELEQALNEQRVEVKHLQEVHNEAVGMRDAARIVLQRQEQQANFSLKTRERQVLEFRKQVENRKMELERIGRKLFLDGKTLTHQDSIGSSSGEQHTAKSEVEDDRNVQLVKMTSEMEAIFKNLMEITGATTPLEVLERFRTQKESSLRLNYLRSAAESEKNQLESHRDKITKQLETSKFSDVNESEINQEIVEKLKSYIEKLQNEEICNVKAVEIEKTILKFIEERLCEMIYKLQEADETDIVFPGDERVIQKETLPTYLMNEATFEDLISILKMKVEQCFELGAENEIKQELKLQRLELGQHDDVFEPFEEKPPVTTPEDGKPQPMPLCYYNLIWGKTQRATGTLSSSPEQANAQAATDDEGEIPSRNVIKRQSVLIIDTKSRRKPFRSLPCQRRK